MTQKSNHQKVTADRGMAILSRILGTMVLMAIPAVGFWWLDKYLKTGFFVWLGFLLGLFIGCVGLYLIVRLAAIEMNNDLKDGRRFEQIEDSGEVKTEDVKTED